MRRCYCTVYKFPAIPKNVKLICIFDAIEASHASWIYVVEKADLLH